MITCPASTLLSQGTAATTNPGNAAVSVVDIDTFRIQVADAVTTIGDKIDSILSLADLSCS